MTRLTTILLFIISINSIAQQADCKCFTGIGSSESDRPSMTVSFRNGTHLSVCGYEQEKISEDEILISEFNVFDCKTGEQLIEYGAVQNCIVRKDQQGLHIIELKFLPAGENWKWKQINIGIQRIFVKENELVVSEQKPNISLTEIDKTKAESFLKDLRKLKGLGEIDDPEEVLGRLEALALINNKEAINILNNFESYFNYQTDGALAEQWKSAVATVEWINN